MALETFKVRLKAKASAAGANLSQKRIDAIADRLDKKFPTPKDDAEHDTAIDGLYDATDLKEFAQVDDYQRTKSAREEKDRKDKEELERKAAADRKPEPDDEPAWFKKYREDNDKKLNGLLEEKQTQSMQQKLAANEKLKGIDAKLYSKWQLPKTDEEIDAFADEVVATYGHLVTKEQPGEAGGQQTGAFVPGQQRQTASTASKKVDPDIIAFAKSKNEQAKTTTKA